MAPSYFLPVVSSGFCWCFPGFLLSVSGDHTLPSSFRLDLFRSFSVEGCCSLHLFIFFLFRLSRLLFSFFCPLPFFRYSSVGFLAIFFLCWGFSLPGISPSPWSSQRMVPAGLILPVFVSGLSFVLFFVSLGHPLRLACFGLGPFLRFFVLSSSLPFSPLGGSCPGFAGLSYASMSSLIPLPCSFRVPSVRVWG